ncbi:hypothetical protein [Parageobacillus thermoglucosidasius]|uniref:Uncharacterized protein n=1 Tax=Geobacillus sp. (strain Y4.1MC1) TaxID=581103 RepID=A0A7U4DMJ9_GEOS0|nr:hypothetical protein [Parageobacillus thermoglucosidasius]OUM84238.1 MAG: hypothetical protein BAA00_17705 [Parageobacillus thermoglucosidasius]
MLLTHVFRPSFDDWIKFALSLAHGGFEKGSSFFLFFYIVFALFPVCCAFSRFSVIIEIGCAVYRF